MKSFLNLFGLCLTCQAVVCCSQPLMAGVVWNEAVDGDLSSIPASPTPVNFNNGANTVIGSLSQPSGDLRDYLTFTIGPNQVLTGMILDAASTGGLSFHALNAGSTSFVPGDDDSSNFLGLEFVFDGLIGLDLLPGLAAGAYGSTGFSIPLGPGTYSYLIQELTPGEGRTYQLSFNVVPEPSSSALVLLSGLTFARRFRRRSSL